MFVCLEVPCLFEGRQCEFHYTLKIFIKQIKETEYGESSP